MPDLSTSYLGLALRSPLNRREKVHVSRLAHAETGDADRQRADDGDERMKHETVSPGGRGRHRLRERERSHDLNDVEHERDQ